MVKDNNVKFQLAWAFMPLDADKLDRIETSHRIRPYLLCMDMGSFYYAFPCTSKLFNTSDRYANEKAVIKSSAFFGSSLVRLGEVYKLPKELISGKIHSLMDTYDNELIKKINACSKYSNYPEEFINHYKDLPYHCNINDLVESKDQLYVITGYKGQKFIGRRVYPFPIDESSLEKVDGLKFYVSLSAVHLLDKDEIKYRSCLDGYCNRMKEIIHLEEVKDYSKLYNLEPGMIISHNDDRYIVVENHITELDVLVGKEEQTYSMFEPAKIPGDSKFRYEVVGFLEDKRFDKLLESKKIKEDKVLKKD